MTKKATSPFDDVKSPYIESGIVGFTPHNLIDRQHAALESVRFFASQIVIVHNRMVEKLSNFDDWQKDTYEKYVPAISDAWFLVEMHYQFWQVCSNLGIFKKGVLEQPDGIEDKKKIIKKFRNHRQHIAQHIQKLILEDPLGGALVWFGGNDKNNFKLHLISLEGSVRWLTKPYKVPRILWSPPVSSVSLVVGSDSLNISELAEMFKEVLNKIYTPIMLSAATKNPDGKELINLGYSGYTTTHDIKVDKIEEGRHQLSFTEEFSAHIVGKTHTISINGELPEIYINVETIGKQIKITYLKKSETD